MKVRIKYEFEGNNVDFITQIPEVMYENLEDYKREVLEWFPNATVEAIEEDPDTKSEIIEFEL